MAGLSAAGGRHLDSRDRRLSLEPRLSPAELAAHGARAAADQGADLVVLEDRGPRHVRRARLAAARTRSRRSSRTPSATASNPQWVQDISVKVTGLRSSAFVTAGDALQVTRGPSRAVGTGGGTFGLASGGLRPGRPTGRRSTRRGPAPAQLAHAGTNYPSFAREWLRVRLPDVAGYRPASPQASAEVSFPLWSMDQAALVTVPGTSMTRPDGAAIVRSSGLGPDLPARAPPARTVRDAVRLRSRRPGPRPERCHVHRAPGAPPERARRVPVRRPARLLPALLRRDGAAAAYGRRPGPDRHGLQPGADRPQARAPTSCATTTPTPGSRPTSRGWGGSRSIPTPAAAPRASRSPTARRRSASAAVRWRRRRAAASRRAVPAPSGGLRVAVGHDRRASPPRSCSSWPAGRGR